jgi:hypothetical protein
MGTLSPQKSKGPLIFRDEARNEGEERFGP